MNDRLPNARAITKQLLCDNFRPKVASDVISGLGVEQGGMNVHVKFGDFSSNRSRDIVRLPHFVTNDAGRRRSSHKGLGGVLPKNKTTRPATGSNGELIGSLVDYRMWPHCRNSYDFS